MAHMVDRMMYAGEVPWHGLGIQLPEVCDSTTLRDLVFDWNVLERPVSYETLTGERQEVKKYRALTRSDNGELLAIMPDTYGVVEYSDALSLLDAASASGETRYITAGTLAEGRRAWALATLPSQTFDVAGSELKPYLLMSTAHDGSRAIRVLFTGVYVVCNNTETAALMLAGVGPGSKAKHVPNVLTVRHTKNAAAKVQQVAGIIASARDYFGAFHETALRLANERFTVAQCADMAEALFPMSDVEAKRRRDGQHHAADGTSTSKARALIVDLFDGRQRAAACAPGTKWAALNAVTELIDHHARRRGATPGDLAEKRFEASLFGNGASMRQKAMDYLVAA